MLDLLVWNYRVGDLDYLVWDYRVMDYLLWTTCGGLLGGGLQSER